MAVALLVIGGIVLFVLKRGKTGRWILAVTSITILFLFLGLFFLRAQVLPPNKQVHIQCMQNVSEPTTITPSIWMPGMENEFKANEYPSILFAAKALARQIETFILEIQPELNNPTWGDYKPVVFSLVGTWSGTNITWTPLNDTLRKITGTEFNTSFSWNDTIDVYESYDNKYMPASPKFVWLIPILTGSRTVTLNSDTEDATTRWDEKGGSSWQSTR